MQKRLVQDSHPKQRESIANMSIVLLSGRKFESPPGCTKVISYLSYLFYWFDCWVRGHILPLLHNMELVPNATCCIGNGRRCLCEWKPRFKRSPGQTSRRIALSSVTLLSFFVRGTSEDGVAV